MLIHCFIVVGKGLTGTDQNMELQRQVNPTIIEEQIKAQKEEII